MLMRADKQHALENNHFLGNKTSVRSKGWLIDGWILKSQSVLGKCTGMLGWIIPTADNCGTNTVLIGIHNVQHIASSCADKQTPNSCRAQHHAQSRESANSPSGGLGGGFSANTTVMYWSTPMLPCLADATLQTANLARKGHVQDVQLRHGAPGGGQGAPELVVE
jgi:hypothetical protein